MLRRIGWGVGAPLVILTGLLVFALTSSDRSLAAVAFGARVLSPYTLEFRDAQLDLFPFSLRAGLLRLRNERSGANEAALLTIQDVDLSMPLLRMLRGRSGRGHFEAENITYYIEDGRNAKHLNLEDLLSPLGWLPQRVDVRSLHLITRSENTQIVPLINLTARRQSDGRLALITEADIGERRVILEALADWRSAPKGGHELDLQAGVYGPNDDSELILEGRVESRSEELTYALSLAGRYTRIEDFVRAFDPEAYSVPGHLDIQGSITGDLSAYQLVLDELAVGDDETYAFSAQGSVSYQEGSPVVIDITADGQAARLDGLIDLPPALAETIERSEVTLRLGGSLAAPVLRELGLVFKAPGRTTVRIWNPNLELGINEISDEAFTGQALIFEAKSADVPAMLASIDARDLPLVPPETLHMKGRLRADGSSLVLQVSYLAADGRDYTLNGDGIIAWRDEVLSLPTLRLELAPTDRAGVVRATGAVSSLSNLKGAVIDVRLDEVDPTRLPLQNVPDYQLTETRVTGGFRATLAGNVWRARDIDLRIDVAPGLDLRLQGAAAATQTAPEADLSFTASARDDALASFGLPMSSVRASGDLRLRPTYFTLLSKGELGSTALQAVVNADLRDRALESLAVDLYSEDITLEDLFTAARQSGQAGTESNSDARKTSDGSLSTMLKALPTWPLRANVRAQTVHSAHTRFQDVNIAVSGRNREFLLEHFDARYAGGDLMFRGAINGNPSAPILSIAGRGISVPLADLTRDLGLQQSISGALSLRGGLTTSGANATRWIEGLSGTISLAARDTTVSGAAYDLLMSNLLAWLVQGNREKTTTFDCSMASFDFAQGRARSDTLFIETPRMLATGTGEIDLKNERAKFRIEPRSKSRQVQFPSAVRIEGPLGDLDVDVSGLKATADLSAQTLLLLPSLTLKLFGLEPDQSAPQPCRPASV